LLLSEDYYMVTWSSCSCRKGPKNGLDGLLLPYSDLMQ